VTVRSFKGKKPVIGDRVYIDDNATVIGNVTIGDDVSIWPSS